MKIWQRHKIYLHCKVLFIHIFQFCNVLLTAIETIKTKQIIFVLLLYIFRFCNVLLKAYYNMLLTFFTKHISVGFPENGQTWSKTYEFGQQLQK